MAAAPADPAAFVKGIADDLHRALSTFARMNAVLITAVNGVAAGAGFLAGGVGGPGPRGRVGVVHDGVHEGGS